jgi:hypothetical protein
MFDTDWSHPREHIAGTRKGLRVHLVRFCVSRHCRDLFGIAFLAALAAVFGARLAEFVLNLWSPTQKAVPGLFQILVTGLPADRDTVILQAGLMTVAGGIISWAYQAANTRFGVVDVFAAEIATLCRVAAVAEFIPHYIDLYDKQRQFPPVNAPRDYLIVFNNNARELEILDGDVARFVTQFYVHMKALQDALARGADPQENQPAALSLIFSAFLAFESARLALAVLMDNIAERQEYVLTVLLSELPAYLLLYRERAVLGGLKAIRIEERLPSYFAMIAKIAETPMEGAIGQYAAQIVAVWQRYAPSEGTRTALSSITTQTGVASATVGGD